MKLLRALYLVVKYWNEVCPGCSILWMSSAKDMKKLSLLLLANNLLLKQLLRRLLSQICNILSVKFESIDNLKSETIWLAKLPLRDHFMGKHNRSETVTPQQPDPELDTSWE
jgi:hypothetical protein